MLAVWLGRYPNFIGLSWSVLVLLTRRKTPAIRNTLSLCRASPQPPVLESALREVFCWEPPRRAVAFFWQSPAVRCNFRPPAGRVVPFVLTSY